jgi:hypothetical protein
VAALVALSAAAVFGANAPAAQTPGTSRATASAITVKACTRVINGGRVDPAPPAGTVFFDQTFPIKYIGGPVMVAEDCDGTGDVFVDDELRINRGSAPEFSHDYSNTCSGEITHAGPHDITSLFVSGVNQVRVRLMELCGGGSGNSNLRLVYNQRCAFRIKTGAGYAGLRPEMKVALDRLYFELEDRHNACYKFSSGFRSQAKQTQLFNRWHDIADKPRGDTRTGDQIHSQLAAAGFAQFPKGYKAANAAGLRVAKGGPARVSRHTSGLAADLTVLFPEQKDLGEYQDAAAKAGLCGPPASDPVHVEMPYRRDGGPLRCHFPESPAPAVTRG